MKINNDEQKIGILDSGIGGFSIYSSARELLPKEDIIYVADKKYFPYGEKSEDVIRERVNALVAFLKDEGATVIVVACNTASVIALEYVRKKHPDIPIIGTVPAIKSATEKTRNGNMGVLCTPGTAKSTYQKDLIKKYAIGKNMYVQVFPGLVEAIEENNIDKIDLAKLFGALNKKNIDTLVLGCTHFPLIKKEIADVLSDAQISILDSGEAIARQVQRILATHEKEGVGKTIFYTTAKPEMFDIMVSRYLGVSEKSKLVEVC